MRMVATEIELPFDLPMKPNMIAVIESIMLKTGIQDRTRAIIEMAKAADEIPGSGLIAAAMLGC